MTNCGLDRGCYFLEVGERHVADEGAVEVAAGPGEYRRRAGFRVLPKSPIQSFQKYPYQPGFGPYNDDGNSTKTPFQCYISAKIKL